MDHAHQIPSPIKICLQDSIFRHRTHHLSHLKTQSHNQQHLLPQTIEPISSFVPQPKQSPKFISYLNAQYYGFSKNNHPQGTGILIDDQMNCFLSSWNKTNMNKLSFVKLLNETILYGTWINNKMHGWNSFSINNFQVFLEAKYTGKSVKQQPIFSTGLVINKTSQICYLLQINHETRALKQSRKLRLQVLNRIQIPSLVKKQYDNDITLLTQQLFEQAHLKIPHFLSSVQTFMNHFSQNNPHIVFKQIPDQNQLNFFISVHDNIPQNQFQLKQFTPFSPYKQIFTKENLNQPTKDKQKSLGIILRQKSFKTKSVGAFDSRYQLNGIGLNVTQKNTKLCGYFKSNLLTRQFNQPQYQKNHSQSSKTQCIKNKLYQHHLKSLDFVHDFVYLKQVNSAVNIVNQIVEYVTAFQNQYRKKYGKALDSFSASQQSFDAKYQVQNQEITYISAWPKKQLNQNMQKRPFGKIVKSRSPLRNINKSHSKSPSDIQTFRQRRPLDFHYVDNSPGIARNQSKNMKNLTIHTHSSFASRYSQQTSKKKSYLQSGMSSNLSYKQMLQAKIRQAQKEDIVETVRRRNQFSQKISNQRISRQRRLQQISVERIFQERRHQPHTTGYKCRYDRLEKRRQVFWK